MTKPVIICVDDEPTVLESLKIELRNALGDRCAIETAEGGVEALELMRELRNEDCEVALVLSDYIMPDLRGDELLEQVHRLSPKTLTVMLTGQADLEAVSRAIKYAKLYRYIAKPWQPQDLGLTAIEAVHSYLQDKKLSEQNSRLQEMNGTLERMNQALEAANRKLELLTQQQAAIIAERTAELERANQELQNLSVTDGLTQLANRRRFDDYLQLEWDRLLREQQPLGLILCDVDFFKRFNDRYGHLAGDDCLRRVARAVGAAVRRPADLVARYGGEEFAIVMPGVDRAGALATAEAVRKAVAALNVPHEQSLQYGRVTISVGATAAVPVATGEPLDWLDAADGALYCAKRRGRNCAAWGAVASLAARSPAEPPAAPVD